MAVINNIDEEWKNFILSNNEYDDDTEEYEYQDEQCINTHIDENCISANMNENLDFENSSKNVIPKSSKIYISTKTKIAYLNNPINLKEMFWIIPVLNYSVPSSGVIKKQMKFNSMTEEELQDIKDRLKKETLCDEQIITSIINPTGRIKFKDIRKITIGLSKKDIMSYRSKKKSAFYNCFVLILRIKVANAFKEFHVKIFNTGKLEIPGIQDDTVFEMILKMIIDILQPNMEDKLYYKENSCDTVLINSNFNCGFYINREILYDILKYKYNIQSIYDPCSYPGIQCKFYFNPDVDLQNGCQISKDKMEMYQNVKKISFMIFRTGSVLIVGKCDENVLFLIYEFLKNILKNEYVNICQKNSNIDMNEINQLKIDKDNKKKIRRKNIFISISA
jgi:disulfide oxidoreductase YuzD